MTGTRHPLFFILAAAVAWLGCDDGGSGGAAEPGGDAADDDPAGGDPADDDAGEDDPGDGPDETPQESPEARGARLYASLCALCHGAQGEGYTADNANALANPDFLRTATDEFLTIAIEQGRPGTTMSAWSTRHGGPLAPDDVAALVVTLRGWQSGAAIELDEGPAEGSALRGEPQYAVRCAGCHGDEGQGVTAVSVSNPVFLATASDGYLRHAIRKGRVGTPMAGYEDTMTPQAIEDVVAVLRGWARPPDEEPTPELPPGHLSSALQNPDGPAPAFAGTEGEYVSVDELKAAMDAGARLVVADARPVSDYVGEHIAGAVSVPFYEAADLAPELPADAWIVTYCACPHAESSASAAALAGEGRTQVRVLDEGLPVWLERGYPVRSGTTP